MKAIATIIAVAVLGAASSAFSQEELPISSTGALRAYALSQARNAYVHASSGTNDTSFFEEVSWEGVKSSAETIAAIKAVKVSFETTDTSAAAHLHVFLTDKDGNGLFWGSSSATPVQNQVGEWVIPASSAKLDLSIADEVRIPLAKRVSSAYVIDANGTYHSIPVSDGVLLFPKISAGLSQGQLKVWYEDNTVATFSTSTGKRIPTFSVSTAVEAAFKDVLSFKDQASITVSVPATNRKGVIPTVEVVKSVPGIVSLTIATSDGKRPTKVWWRLGTSDQWQSVTAGASGPINVNLPAGVIYIVPEWNPSDFSEETRALSYGDLGKG